MDAMQAQQAIQSHCPDWLECNKVSAISDYNGKLHHYNANFIVHFCDTGKLYASKSFATLAELVAETIEVVKTLKGEPMNIFSTDLFRYISGEMIGEKDATKVIDRVVLEKLRGQSGVDEEKPVLYFKGSKKGWILNKTSARAIADKLGGETTAWKGAKVVLHAPMISAFGRQMRAIRVKQVFAPTGEQFDITDEPSQEELLESTPNGAYSN